MDLFGKFPPTNLLPSDGEAIYHGPVLSLADSRELLQTLIREIPWAHDETVMFGKRIVTARQVAWVADCGISYSYSGTTKQALPWTETLRKLQRIVQSHTGSSYNSCLLNLYQHGGEGMGWHSDDEKSLVENSSIAALSLGAERKFSFKHKQSRQTHSVQLENGSLLDMRGSTQRHWLHQLPKTTKITQPRISLTFRTMAV